MSLITNETKYGWIKELIFTIGQITIQDMT